VEEVEEASRRLYESAMGVFHSVGVLETAVSVRILTFMVARGRRQQWSYATTVKMVPGESNVSMCILLAMFVTRSQPQSATCHPSFRGRSSAVPPSDAAMHLCDAHESRIGD